MEVDVERREPGLAIVRLKGRLDLVSAPAVKNEFVKAVSDGATRLIVDLSGVSFVDSSGLGALIGGLRVARTAGGDLRIASPGEQARVILGLTTLDRVLTPHESVDAALAGF